LCDVANLKEVELTPSGELVPSGVGLIP
jgi:hypothetical protein